LKMIGAKESQLELGKIKYCAMAQVRLRSS
jgi:hypothetical protein